MDPTYPAHRTKQKQARRFAGGAGNVALYQLTFELSAHLRTKAPENPQRLQLSVFADLIADDAADNSTTDGSNRTATGQHGAANRTSARTNHCVLIPRRHAPATGQRGKGDACYDRNQDQCS